MDDGVHDVGIGHDDGSRTAQADHHIGKQQIIAALQKLVHDLVGGQAAANAGQDPHHQEQSGQLVNVKAKLKHAHDHADDTAHKDDQNQDMPLGQGRYTAEIDGILPLAVDLVHSTAHGVLLHSDGSEHHIHDADAQQSHKGRESQSDAGEHRQAGNTLGHSYRKCVGTATGVSGSRSAKDNAQCGQGVKAHGDTDGNDQGNKYKKFLIVGCKAGAHAEDQHADRDQEKLFSRHLFDHVAHSAADRSSGIHNAKGAADDKQEKDHVT